MAAMLSEPARLMSPSPSALDLCEYDYDFDFYPPAVGAAASAASTPRTLHPSNTNAKNQNQNTNADPGSRLINNGNGNGNVNTARPLKLGSLAFPESLPLPLPLSTPSSSSAATVTVYANTHTHTSTNPNPARKPLPTRPSTTPSTTPAITAGPGKTTASSSSSSTATTASLAKPTRPPPPKRVLSSFMPPSLPSSHNHNHKGKPTLLLLLTNPPVLSQLLAHLPWTSTWPLLNTCKTTRHGVFSDPALRDEVLVRYVTGYRYAMGVRDERFFKDVKVSVGDLDLLLISQKYPLHQYPTHALRLLSSLYPTLEDDEKTAKLVALTQAHSRFVLLLQSLVHSSCEPLVFDAEEGFALGDRERLGRGERKWRARSRFAPLSLPLPLPLPMAHNAPLTQTLRELTFPAPLAYTQPNVHVEKQPRGEVSSASKTQKGRGAGTIRSKSATTNTRHKHSLSQPQVVTTTTTGAHATELEELGFSTHSIARHNTYAYTYGGPSPSANRLSSLAMISSSSNTRKGRRLSIFSKTPPPPPPPEEPKTLKIYASTWRRRTRRDSRSVDFGMVSGSGALRIPERRFATEAGGNGSGSNDASSDSSMSAATASAPPSIAGRDTPLSSSFHGSGSGSGFGSGFTHSTSSSTSSSPHDLTLATRRTRAPILRVFVPCTKLDDGDGDEDESASIVQCEKQLEEAGLWTHLSTGDVVCNLGYIPPIGGGGDDSSSLDRDRFDEEMMRIPMSVLQGDHHHNRATGGSDFLMRGFSTSTDTSPRGSTFGSGNSAHGQGQGQPQAKWLLFNGQFLIPYTPPDLLPLDDPLSLPSPYYYAHITPSPPPPYASHTHTHASRLHPAHALASSNLITNITANPTFVIPRFPLCDDVPQLRLVHTTSKVPSPHSPSGYALVRRWAWTARVVRVRHSSPPSSSSSSGLYSGSGLGPSTVGGGMVGGIGAGGAGEMGMGMGMGMGTEDAGNLGEGWYGEWILEYEGTKEGKQVLLHALAGKMLGRRVWELVREKCGPGRIWLRLLPT